MVSDVGWSSDWILELSDLNMGRPKGSRYCGLLNLFFPLMSKKILVNTNTSEYTRSVLRKLLGFVDLKALWGLWRFWS